MSPHTEMVCVRVASQVFSVPIDHLNRHMDSALYMSYINEKHLAKSEPFDRDPDIFMACVLPFLCTDVINVPPVCHAHHSI